jgi:hypothetical protein
MWLVPWLKQIVRCICSLFILTNRFFSFQTYTLTLTAAMQSDISLATTATVEITVESTPLNAVIKGTE